MGKPKGDTVSPIIAYHTVTHSLTHSASDLIEEICEWAAERLVSLLSKKFIVNH